MEGNAHVAASFSTIIAIPTDKEIHFYVGLFNTLVAMSWVNSIESSRIQIAYIDPRSDETASIHVRVSIRD